MNPKATELLSKLRSITRSDYDGDALLQIDGWINQIEELDALDALSTHFMVERWIEEDKAEIKSIEETLIHKRGMEMHERDLLLDKKLMYTKNVHRFDSSARLDEIARMIDESL